MESAIRPGIKPSRIRILFLASLAVIGILLLLNIILQFSLKKDLHVMKMIYAEGKIKLNPSASTSLFTPTIEFDPIALNRARKREIQEGLQRVYYINLEKNYKRRKMMNNWLQNQRTPFHRVNASIGSDNPKKDCRPGRQDPDRCRGMTGVLRSNLDIIQNYNTSGLTFILEDDFRVYVDLHTLVEKTLKLVPIDWDIIRWHCIGKIPSTFQVKRGARFNPLNKTEEMAKIFRTEFTSPGTFFCGGAYAMLWRDSSLPSLVNVWSEYPLGPGIDCLLTTPKLKSYCVNFGPVILEVPGIIGGFHHPEGERSDIPKKKNPGKL